MYSKMVPHHIEGMMLGFVWSMIKLNADVFARLITVGLNLKFMVRGEIKTPETAFANSCTVAAESAGASTIHGMALAATAAIDATIGEGTGAPEAAVGHEGSPFMNLYKMYLIQAGMVAFPIFFVWIIAKRARIEEV